MTAAPKEVKEKKKNQYFIIFRNKKLKVLSTGRTKRKTQLTFVTHLLMSVLVRKLKACLGIKRCSRSKESTSRQRTNGWTYGVMYNALTPSRPLCCTASTVKSEALSRFPYLQQQHSVSREKDTNMAYVTSRVRSLSFLYVRDWKIQRSATT